jgi:hypothetical protein
VRPLYIFDLDGTLALIEHRRHLLPNWPAFFAACVGDMPNLPVIRTFNMLRKAGAETWIWSGRSDEVRSQTIEWLKAAGIMGWTWLGAPEAFRMRPTGDYTPDEVLKAQWLSEIEPPEYKRLTAVFDDRDKVVAMWRAHNVPCFQVAQGSF